MENYAEDEYLQLSGIQHYAFCPRQWALIHVENKWSDNWRTTLGSQMHKRVHDSNQIEKRGDTIMMRALKVVSHTLGLSGECDVVEFQKNVDGIELHGYLGRYLPFPIEYKRGKANRGDCDKLQLTAQAVCLEEMLLCKISCGALYYGAPHRRVEVEFSDELRRKTMSAADEMHKFADRGYTPKAKQYAFCDECSLKNECVPEISKMQSVKDYIKKHLEEDG
jgi:CRISPR-associated exonuclease Cas4